MATPNADRLRGIGQWDPSANDATSDVLGAIKTELDSVADLTESVATNLGSAIKGSTAEAVTASLDALGKKVRRHSEDIGVIVEARKEALDAGREAQNKNIEIQQELAEAQARYDSVVKKEPYLQAEMRALRTLDADHAKAENQAITALSTLRERTAAAIQRIPALGGEETGSSNGDEPGRRRSGDRQSSGGSDSRRRSGNGGTGGDGSGSGQNGSGAGGPGSGGSGDAGASGGSGDAGASGGSASGPIRSATRWSATIPDPSAGSSGSVSPGGDGGPTLQRSHFTVHQTGDVSQGAVRPSILHSSSVHNPAAAAAAATGGAAVAGYKAYQAVRSARAASRSEAAVRANGTAAQGARMTRGATTAAREASATTAKGATAKGALARGGASGIARPAATSARSGGIVRGATTAQRAVSQTPARSSGIVKGATTASRASVPNAPQGTSGGAGRPGAGSKAARSGVRALTARGAQAGAGASSSARGGNSGRSGNVARGAAASRGNGSAGSVRTAGSVRGAGAARGTGASAKNAAAQRAGVAGARGAGSARGSQAGPRASTGAQGASSARPPAASGLKNGTFKQGVSPRPAGSVGKGGIVWRSAPDAAPASATTRAVAGLAAGRRRNGEEEALRLPEGLSQASDYEQGREVTFLEAGTWQCGEAAAWQQDKAVPPKTGEAAAWQQGQTAVPQNKGTQHDGAGNF